MSKQNAIEKLQKKAAQLLLMANRINLLPDNLPELAEVGAQETYLTIDLPFDLSLLKQTRKALGKDWQFNHSFNADDGRKFIVYLSRDKIDLTICLKPTKEGSVCKLNQIGVKEVPIFEVVCHA